MRSACASAYGAPNCRASRRFSRASSRARPALPDRISARAAPTRQGSSPGLSTSAPVHRPASRYSSVARTWSPAAPATSASVCRASAAAMPVDCGIRFSPADRRVAPARSPRASSPSTTADTWATSCAGPAAAGWAPARSRSASPSVTRPTRTRTRPRQAAAMSAVCGSRGASTAALRSRSASSNAEAAASRAVESSRDRTGSRPSRASCAAARASTATRSAARLLLARAKAVEIELRPTRRLAPVGSVERLQAADVAREQHPVVHPPARLGRRVRGQRGVRRHRLRQPARVREGVGGRRGVLQREGGVRAEVARLLPAGHRAGDVAEGHQPAGERTGQGRVVGGAGTLVQGAAQQGDPEAGVAVPQGPAALVLEDEPGGRRSRAAGRAAGG